MNTSPASDTHGAACRASKHQRAHYLITADESSMLELETLIATLPICATGRIFIEVPDAAWVGQLAAPPRMVVSWLDRSRRSGDAGSGRACAAGQALARAVTGWADEMMCGEHAGINITLLGGFLGTADIVDHLVDRHGVARDEVHVPAAFSDLIR